MELRQLRYFVTAIEAGTLTKAAEILSVAQPAVSQQILKLEEELGEQLLMRHSRGVEPTEAGARLLSHAAAILRQLDAARQDLDELKGEAAGEVRVGMPRSITELIGVRFFEECGRRLPKIGLTMIERLSEGLNELLAEGRLDLAFSYNPEQLAMLAYEPLVQLDLSLVAPPDVVLPTTSDGTVPFAVAAKLPLIMPTQPHGLRALAEETAAASGLVLNIVHQVDSVSLIAEMVIANLGCTIHPVGAFRRAAATGLVICRRIVDPPLSRTLYLCYSRRRPLSRAQLAVRELMRDMIERTSAAGAFLEPLAQEGGRVLAAALP
ncbi:MAG TPA: LysR substrate-binding domain-containing protein [Stellaceae bacterium]|nr:LysR substrate-binding domain-containing protein [Stellaceae bacterium]